MLREQIVKKSWGQQRKLDVEMIKIVKVMNSLLQIVEYVFVIGTHLIR